MRAKIFSLPSDDARALSLELPPNTPFEEWIAIGTRIAAERNRSAWRLGDWWRLGGLAYGERRRIVEAPGWIGPSFAMMADYAWIAGKFAPERRRKSLSLQHHREVASLAPDKADALLIWAEEPLRQGKRWPRSTRELREEMHQRHDPPKPPVIPVSVTHTPVATTQRIALTVAEPVRSERTTIPVYVPHRDLLAEARAAAKRLDDGDAYRLLTELAERLGIKLVVN
jgi:hypothetical protein